MKEEKNMHLIPGKNKRFKQTAKTRVKQ